MLKCFLIDLVNRISSERKVAKNAGTSKFEYSEDPLEDVLRTSCGRPESASQGRSLEVGGGRLRDILGTNICRLGNYAQFEGAILCYSGAAFRPRTPQLFGWENRNLSATNQRWSLWLYTKPLMDMFLCFWIRRPSTFGKYSIFHPLRRFSANNITYRNTTLFIFSRPKIP